MFARSVLRHAFLEGVIPTKVNRRKDGGVDAVFDRLGALIVDAKMAGEFDGVKIEEQPEIEMTFEVYHRNHPNPPREWMQRRLETPETLGHL